MTVEPIGIANALPPATKSGEIMVNRFGSRDIIKMHIGKTKGKVQYDNNHNVYLATDWCFDCDQPKQFYDRETEEAYCPFHD